MPRSMHPANLNLELDLHATLHITCNCHPFSEPRRNNSDFFLNTKASWLQGVPLGFSFEYVSCDDD